MSIIRFGFDFEYEYDSEGFFGSYGGKFVPETLMEALDELEKCYEDKLAN